MIKTTISKTEYNIPSSWNDVTFLKYCDAVMAQGELFMNRLSIYTGIEIDVLQKLTYKAIIELSQTVEFMDTPDDVTAFAEGYESKINIGTETYEKLEASKIEIQKAKIPLLGAVAMVKHYTGEDISEKAITQSIGQAVFFLTHLESSWRNSPASTTTLPTPMKWRQVLKNLQSLAVGVRPPLTPAGQI